MSEYQYYEFAAIDRPLTAAELAQLRKVSTHGHEQSVAIDRCPAACASYLG